VVKKGMKNDPLPKYEKYLNGRDASLLARFEAKTQPDSAVVVGAIEAELGKKS
jgi:glutathione peroxidase-family protein